MDELQIIQDFETSFAKHILRISHSEGKFFFHPASKEDFIEGVLKLKNYTLENLLPEVFKDNDFQKNQDKIIKAIDSIFNAVIEKPDAFIEIFSNVAKILSYAATEKIPFPGMATGYKFDIPKLAKEVTKHKSLIKVYDKLLRRRDFILHIKNRWKTSSSKKLNDDQLKILEDALLAHHKKLYTLSVPAFLIIMEFLFESIFSDEERESKNFKRLEKRRKFILGHIGKTKDSSNTPLKFLFAGDGLTILSNEILANIQDAKIDSIFPNRHEILHGKNMNYFKDSLQSTLCIIVLDSLLNTNLDEFKPSHLKTL